MCSQLPLSTGEVPLPHPGGSGGNVSVSILPALSLRAEPMSTPDSSGYSIHLSGGIGPTGRGWPSQGQPESFLVMYPMGAAKDKFLSFEL